jgi:hypothetical protein
MLIALFDGDALVDDAMRRTAVWLKRSVITDDAGQRCLDPEADLSICLWFTANEISANRSPLRDVAMTPAQARAVGTNLVIVCADREAALNTQRGVGGDGFPPSVSADELLRWCGVRIVPDVSMSAL